MAKRRAPKTIETMTHAEASRKNIPTAEYQAVMESIRCGQTKTSKPVKEESPKNRTLQAHSYCLRGFQDPRFTISWTTCKT